MIGQSTGAWQRCAVLCSDRDDDLALVDRRDLFSVFFSFWLFLLLSLGFGTSIHEWKFDGVVLGHGDRRLGSRCEPFGRLRLRDGVLTGRQIRDVELTIVLAVADPQLDRPEHVEAGLRYGSPFSSATRMISRPGRPRAC